MLSSKTRAVASCASGKPRLLDSCSIAAAWGRRATEDGTNWWVPPPAEVLRNLRPTASGSSFAPDEAAGFVGGANLEAS